MTGCSGEPSGRRNNVYVCCNNGRWNFSPVTGVVVFALDTYHWLNLLLVPIPARQVVEIILVALTGVVSCDHVSRILSVPTDRREIKVKTRWVALSDIQNLSTCFLVSNVFSQSLTTP